MDLSPMGCRTGFYMVLDGDPSPETVMHALEKTLERIKAFAGPIPGTSELECGNYRDHNLDSARDWASKVLERGLKVQETIKIPEGASSQ
jgi:S-ribosylhomocysteine lyase